MVSGNVSDRTEASGGGSRLPPERRVGGADGEDYERYEGHELDLYELELANNAVELSPVGMYAGELGLAVEVKRGTSTGPLGNLAIVGDMSLVEKFGWAAVN